MHKQILVMVALMILILVMIISSDDGGFNGEVQVSVIYFSSAVFWSVEEKHSVLYKWL